MIYSNSNNSNNNNNNNNENNSYNNNNNNNNDNSNNNNNKVPYVRKAQIFVALKYSEELEISPTHQWYRRELS